MHDLQNGLTSNVTDTSNYLINHFKNKAVLNFTWCIYLRFEWTLGEHFITFDNVIKIIYFLVIYKSCVHKETTYAKYAGCKEIIEAKTTRTQ